MKLDEVTKKFKGVQKTVVSTAKKVLAGLFGFFSFSTGGLSALFFILGFIQGWPILVGLGAFFVFLTAFFVVLTIALLRSGSQVFSKSHHEDIDICESLLKRIEDVIDHEHVKTEFKGVYKSLKKELKSAKILARKIDGINKTMREPEWNLENVKARLAAERQKILPNEEMIVKLEEQIKNVKILKDRELKLRDQLAMLRQDFNSIYTKLTLLDTSERVQFDKIETEIQTILDRKLRVQKYEDQLDNESVGLDL